MNIVDLMVKQVYDKLFNELFNRVKIVRNVWMNLMIQIQQNSALF